LEAFEEFYVDLIVHTGVLFLREREGEQGNRVEGSRKKLWRAVGRKRVY